jgi:glycosyltransferase involved in cell wall biosynthesis
MLVHFSCERMDDNIASFMTKGAFGKWFARRVMGNYNFPIFDFHIANSPYTAQEFYNASKNRKTKVAPIGFSINAGSFSKLRAFLSKNASTFARAASTASFFARKKIRSGKKREMRERAGIPENSIALLYAGRISPEKNIGLLVG